MGLALKQIRKGGYIINTHLTADYQSSSEFSDAFSNIIRAAPSKIENKRVLYAAWVNTFLGSMIVIADKKNLFLLEFIDRKGLEKEILQLKKKAQAAIIPGITESISSIEKELKDYFDGKLREFKTPVFLFGSVFQKRVWKELNQIPYGQTRSYSAIATTLGKAFAFRAVARANATNQFAIIIPCHRVTNRDGSLSGYGGGIARKKWLINHEKNNVNK